MIKNYCGFSAQERSVLDKTLPVFYNENFPLSPWSEKHFRSILTSKNTLCIIWKEKGSLAGFILGRRKRKDSPDCNLAILLVEKHFRKQGGAQNLIRKFLAEIRKNPTIKRVYLHFREENPLQNLYSRSGFAGYKQDGSYRNGDKKYLMELCIVKNIDPS